MQDQSRDPTSLFFPSLPDVGKFMQNIYTDIYFEDSALYDYFDSFYTGYAMDSYQYASECKANTTSFLNTLHDFKINVTDTTEQKYWN
jgi:hypothetical protein